MNWDLEIKQIAKLIIGDIRVDVDIKFMPQSYPHSFEEQTNIESVNLMLSRLGGELEYEIKKIIKNKLKESHD